VGGVLADRANRRRVLAACQSIQMLCPTILVVLIVTRTVQPWIVVALSSVVRITDALSMPSFQTIVPSIVQREQLASALAINATQFNLSRILGPAFAGALMVSVGVIGCFVLNAPSYLPFIWLALWILPLRDHQPSGVDWLTAAECDNCGLDDPKGCSHHDVFTLIQINSARYTCVKMFIEMT
jgi:MFS family permease